MLTKPETAYVLIVEDDRDVAFYFRSVMQMAGYRVGVAANGLQALDMLFSQPPDIVLLDLSLPRITGTDILLILKTTPRFSQIRTVVITGFAQMANDLPVEPDLVLEKPVSPDQLTSLVERLCQQDVPIPLPRAWQDLIK